MGLVATIEAVIDLLKADTVLNLSTWHFGMPLTRTYPFGYVKLDEGPIDQQAMKVDLWSLNIHVVVVHSTKTDDDAEKYVANAIDRISVILAANPTLKGTVRDTRQKHLSADNLLLGTDWGHINENIAAAILTIQVLFLKEKS
jgi:hypothetical protein